METRKDRRGDTCPQLAPLDHQLIPHDQDDQPEQSIDEQTELAPILHVQRNGKVDQRSTAQPEQFAHGESPVPGVHAEPPMGVAAGPRRG